MTLLIHRNPVVLWQGVVKHAEDRCSILLKEELETYLISLLIRYTNKPELAQQVLATTYLDALHHRVNERCVSLQHVGDQCLLFAGLFPHSAEKKHVKISYFVDLGRSAYAAISRQADDLHGSLALQFVPLMDVLQSIRPTSDLMPLEAYEQWEEVGSQRALQVLREYTGGIPPFNKGLRVKE